LALRNHNINLAYLLTYLHCSVCCRAVWSALECWLILQLVEWKDLICRQVCFGVWWCLMIRFSLICSSSVCLADVWQTDVSGFARQGVCGVEVYCLTGGVVCHTLQPQILDRSLTPFSDHNRLELDTRLPRTWKCVASSVRFWPGLNHLSFLVFCVIFVEHGTIVHEAQICLTSLAMLSQVSSLLSLVLMC
jgi:hypothetical protein